MHIAFATQDDTGALWEMWKICFGDDDSYINAYFKNVYRPENTLIAWENDVRLGSLQMLPHTFYIDGTAHRSMYIGGVCVLPAYRKRGIASELMHFAETHMISRGIELSFLVPFSFSFYEKLGYRAISFLSEFSGPTSALTPYVMQDVSPVETKIPPTLAYSQFAARFPVFLGRDEERFEKEIFPLSESAKCYALPHDAGYILCASRGEILDVLEIAYKDEAALSRLLGFIHAQKDKHVSFRIRAAADGTLRKFLCENTITEKRFPHGMIKTFIPLSLPCSFENYINMLGWF